MNDELNKTHIPSLDDFRTCKRHFTFLRDLKAVIMHYRSYAKQISPQNSNLIKKVPVFYNLLTF